MFSKYFWFNSVGLPKSKSKNVTKLWPILATSSKKPF